MPFDKFPYTNFHELNLDYFIQHFKEIFAQWATLYDTMLSWKDATTAELAAWREEVETEIAAWETNLLAALDTWKTQTETDISTWETATLAALDAWKTAFETLFDTTFSNLSDIKTDAEAARDAAIAAQTAAETAAASVSASAAQIALNTSDIADLNSTILDIATPYNVLDFSEASDNTGLSSTDGTASENNSYWVTDFIEIQDETYILSNYNLYKVCYYDASKTFVSATATLNEKYTTVADAVYARVQFAKATVPFNTADAYIIFCPYTYTFNPVKDALKSDNFFLAIGMDDFDFVTGNKIKGLSDAMSVSFEAGTINGTTGQDAAGSSRFRSVGYLPIDAFYAYENGLGLKTRVMAYNNDLSFAGGMGTGMGIHYYTRQEVLTIYPNCKYIRFIFQTDTLTDVTIYTKIYGTETYFKAIKAYDISTQETEPVGYSYSGERVVINRNRLTYDVYEAFEGYGQDALIYGDYAFLFKPDKVLVRRLSTKSNVISPDLPVTAHCNAASWGNKYDSDDVFPLIYVNAYNATGVSNGVCYVFRVTTGADGRPTGLTLVQTITVGFANTEPWTDGNDVRPYGNFFVDTDSGYLWAYTLKDAANVTRFFKFAIPDVSNSTVTIASTDILEQFDIQYMPYIQGNTFNDGKVYILSGYGTATYPGMLTVVNLCSKAAVTQVVFNDIGLQIEPEFIDLFGNSLIIGQTTAYEFKF